MNDMVVMVILLLVVFGVLGVGVFVLKKALVVTDPTSSEEMNANEGEQTAQDFIPIIDIKDSMVYLGNHRYRAILECSSVNYMLKTEREREIIEQSFQRFVSSVTFPISFHIQTRTIDNTEVVRSLEKDISQLTMTNKLMEDYAKMYLESMKSFDAYIGSAKQKKKYIIISYEDAYGLTDLTSEEKEELSRQQLRERTEFVKGQLSAIGIKAERLDNEGLISLLYSTYHREDVQYDMIQALAGGQCLNSIVVGQVKSNNMTPEEKIDIELVRIQNLLKDNYLDLRLGRDSAQYQKMADLYKGIDEVRTILDKPYGGELKIIESKSKDEVKVDKKVDNFVKNKRVEEFNYEKTKEDVKEDFTFNFEETKEDVKEDFAFDFGETKEDVKEDFAFNFKETKEDVKEDFAFDFGETKEDVKEDFAFDFGETKEDVKEDFTFDFGETKEDVKEDFTFDFEETKEDVKEDFTFDFEETKEDVKEDFTFDFGDKLEDVKEDFTFDFGDKLEDLFNSEEDDDVIITSSKKRR